MRRLTLLLLILIGIELAGLGWNVFSSPSRDFPEVDLELLGDRVSIDELARLRRQLDRHNPADWKQLGEFYLTFGFYPQAELCLRVSRQLAPHDDSLILLRAICLDRLGRKREAIEQYRLATQNNVRDAFSYRIRVAQCLLAEADDEAAVAELKRIGEQPDAQLLLCRILIRSGRAREAQSILNELQHKYPDGVEAHSMACWAAEELNDCDTAYAAQSRALRTRRNIAGNRLIRVEDVRRREQHSNLIFHHRSIALEAAGRIEESREACRQAIDALWEEDMVLSSALLEINLGHAELAMELLKNAIERVGGSARGLEALGDAWNLAGDAVQARDAWLRATEMQDTSNLEEKLARSFDIGGDPSRARWHRGLADYQRGKEAWLDNDVSAAHDWFKSATEKAAEHAESWYYLAETERLEKKIPAARSAYEQCLRINANHGRARDALERLNHA